MKAADLQLRSSGDVRRRRLAGKPATALVVGAFGGVPDFLALTSTVNTSRFLIVALRSEWSSLSDQGDARLVVVNQAPTE